MKRSHMEANIQNINIEDELISIDFLLENHTDETITIDVKRCTFLDFAEVQSVSKEKDQIPSFDILPNDIFELHIHFECTDHFLDTETAAITLDLFDHSVNHHISYSFDIEHLNHGVLKDVYESDLNDPIFEGTGGEMIQDLINQLRDSFGANVVVKEVDGDTLEDLLEKKNKLIN